MEKAIEVVRQSVHQPRKDGRASPFVGAVIYKADGTIEAACRGELRHGDHAEFTLLERKNRGNKFIAQAMERAAAVEEAKPTEVTLSTLEKPFSSALTDDFSTDALELYRFIAKIKDKVGTPSFNRRLVLQGLSKHEDGRFTPTGFGLLLFGKEPRTVIPQAGLLATIFYPNGTEEPSVKPDTH